jgi:hypothetical protein
MLKFNIQHSNAHRTIDVKSLQFNNQHFKRIILYDIIIIKVTIIQNILNSLSLLRSLLLWVIPIGWLVGWLVGQSVGWLVNPLVGWSILWLVGQSSGWLVNPLAC